MMNPKLKVVTIGSGKGGVGKSLLTTNMAVAMALSGMKVVLADTDFGASNLHALLGISNPKYGFQDYFHQEDADPASLLLDTGVDNLKFISGSGDLPGSANLSHEQVRKITEVLHSLEADLLFLDLPPGNAFSTVDFFNLGHDQVVVTTPEMTSAMNSLSFIKAALFRRLAEDFSDTPEIQNLLDYSQHPGVQEDIFEVNRLRMKILDVNKEALPRLNAAIRHFKPNLIVNRVRKKRDVLMGDNVVQLAKKYLEVDVNYLGFVIESDKVHDSVDEMIPFLIKDPQSQPSANVQKIIGNLTDMDIHLIKKEGAIFVSKQIKLSSSWGS